MSSNTLFRFQLVFAIFLNDKLAVIVAALGANMMVFLKLMALRALCKTGGLELPICRATGFGFGFGNLIFRYCHIFIHPTYFNFYAFNSLFSIINKYYLVKSFLKIADF